MSSKVFYLRFDQPNLFELSDEALVDAVGQGDRGALGELFTRYHKHVYRFLVRLTAYNAPDLDDMVQNTFIEVAGSASRFAKRSSPKTWIFGIAVNVARMRMRSEKRRFRALSALEELPVMQSSTPQDQTEKKEKLLRLQSAMHRLPVPLREAFVLCALEDMPCIEAARSLGIPEGTLWRRLHDARVKIAKEMKKEA